MHLDEAPAAHIGRASFTYIDDTIEGVLRRYDLAAPQGVRGRNSDNALVRRQLGWEPSMTIEGASRRPIPDTGGR